MRAYMKRRIIKGFAMAAVLALVCLGSAFMVYAGEPSSWAKDILEQAASEDMALYFENYQANISRVDFCRLIRLFINKEVVDEFIVETIMKAGYPFSDTDNNNVSLCYGAGIVNGTGDNMFSPNAPLTREQAAVIVLNALAFVEKYQSTDMVGTVMPADLPFEDAAMVSDWAFNAVSIAYQLEILKGDGVSFNPLSAVTCEQAIILMYQSYKMLERQGLGGNYTMAELNSIRYIMQEFEKLSNAPQGDFYVQMPRTQAPHAAGEVKQSVIDSGLAGLNLARYIAGLPNDIKDDNLYKSYAQAGAVLLDVIGYNDHLPEKPEDMTDDFYYLARNGTSRSNLAHSYEEENPVSAVWAYMHDSDEYNIEVVGHRRWMLSQKMAKSSVGISGNFNTLYVVDESRQGDRAKDFVAWPGNVFPISQMSKDLAWSVSLDESYLKNNGNIKINMTRMRDNKSWIIDPTISNRGGGFFNVNEESFGGMPAIIFRLQAAYEEELYTKNDVFFVEIEGLAKPLSYTVKLFGDRDLRKLDYTGAR